MSDEIFTVTARQAAERTGISEDKIRDLCKAGHIIGYKPTGNAWLIDWQSLKDWIQAK